VTDLETFRAWLDQRFGALEAGSRRVEDKVDGLARAAAAQCSEHEALVRRVEDFEASRETLQKLRVRIALQESRNESLTTELEAVKHRLEVAERPRKKRAPALVVGAGGLGAGASIAALWDQIRGVLHGIFGGGGQ
jgi:hypothetical protein